MAKLKVASPFPTASKAKPRVPRLVKKPEVKPQRSTTSARVGAQIQSQRMAIDMSAGSLASAAGISRSMMSRIERGLVSPSIEVLNSIANALDIPMSRFFVDQVRRLDISFVPAGKGLKVEREDAVRGYHYELVGHLLSGNLFVEPYVVKLSADAKPYPAFQHPGVKLIYMLTGRMKYRYGGQSLDVKAGDSMLFDALALHGAEALEEGPISYLSIIFSLRE